MQSNRLSKNNKGVTLVEVIAVIAVLGVVMAAVTGFMITGARMSAKVSNQAKLDIRQQTAVEFINQRLWEESEVAVDTTSTKISEKYSALTIGAGVLKTDFGDSPENLQDCRVIYNNVELCKGYITFSYDPDNKTVTYYLNDTEHIVHLRETP